MYIYKYILLALQHISIAFSIEYRNGQFLVRSATGRVYIFLTYNTLAQCN